MSFPVLLLRVSVVTFVTLASSPTPAGPFSLGFLLAGRSITYDSAVLGFKYVTNLACRGGTSVSAITAGPVEVQMGLQRQVWADAVSAARAVPAVPVPGHGIRTGPPGSLVRTRQPRRWGADPLGGGSCCGWILREHPKARSPYPDQVMERPEFRHKYNISF